MYFPYLAKILFLESKYILKVVTAPYNGVVGPVDDIVRPPEATNTGGLSVHARCGRTWLSSASPLGGAVANWLNKEFSMMKFLRKIKIGKSGASAAEYALILAVIGGGIVVAAVALSGSISGALNKTAATITKGS